MAGWQPGDGAVGRWQPGGGALGGWQPGGGADGRWAVQGSLSGRGSTSPYFLWVSTALACKCCPAPLTQPPLPAAAAATAPTPPTHTGRLSHPPPPHPHPPTHPLTPTHPHPPPSPPPPPPHPPTHPPTPCRSSTLLQRLPFLPDADAYVCEGGGLIYLPTSPLPTAAPLTEDREWRRRHADTAGPPDQAGLPPQQRRRADGAACPPRLPACMSACPPAYAPRQQPVPLQENPCAALLSLSSGEPWEESAPPPNSCITPMCPYITGCSATASCGRCGGGSALNHAPHPTQGNLQPPLCLNHAPPTTPTTTATSNPLAVQPSCCAAACCGRSMPGSRPQG